MTQPDLFTDCQPFAVVAVCSWQFGGGCLADQKQWGQVTKCRTPAGLTFYVRENLDSTWSFHMSSGERWRDKGGNYGGRSGRQKEPSGPSDWRQCLDLAAPPGHWDTIAALVRAADTLQRPVPPSLLYAQLGGAHSLPKPKGRTMSTRDLKAKYGASLNTPSAVNAAIREELPGGEQMLDALELANPLLLRNPAAVGPLMSTLRQGRDAMADEIRRRYDMPPRGGGPPDPAAESGG